MEKLTEQSRLWRGRRSAVFALAVAVAGLCASCTSSNYVRYTRQEPIDPKTDGQYDVTGYIHARDWSTCFFYWLPAGSDLDYKSASDIARPSVGDIGPVAFHTENYTINPAIAWAHYGGFLPYVVGTKCNYISATYVAPKTRNTNGNGSK